MKRLFLRRIRRTTSSAHEVAFFKRDSHEQPFFKTNAANKTFFSSAQPGPVIHRKCENCETEEKKPGRLEQKEDKLQRQTAGPETENTFLDNALPSPGNGQPLPEKEQAFFAQRMGHNFSSVRIHTNGDAAKSADSLNARAYTVGENIVFAENAYNPSSAEGKKLLAHELTHVVQQSGSVSGPIQRAIRFNVLDWDASAVHTPTPQNAADPRMIIIPPRDQILVSGLIETNGAAADPCSDYEFGTTQTAWMAWVHISFRGRTAAEGSVVIRYNAAMPMRDPGVRGNIWYDNDRVRSAAACGDSTGVFHNDGPWHTISKAVHNASVTGHPLNYLTGYTRGLHLVTYLTARQKGGAFLRSPLKFRYWNSIQDFAFTPNFATPLATWGYTGAVRVNIGSKGAGKAADAPYYTTAGTKYNDHFNNSGNWTVTERR